MYYRFSGTCFSVLYCKKKDTAKPANADFAVSSFIEGDD